MLVHIIRGLRTLNVKGVLSNAKECKLNLIKKEDTLSRFKPSFSPSSLGVDIFEPRPSADKAIKDPIAYIPIISPRSILPLIDNAWKREEIGLPTPKQEEKQAVRLIVIRRKKMKKHKRRKLMKRMKYKWAKRDLKRRQLKEKAFQAELQLMMKEAMQFSAEQYVKDKLQQANYEPLPKRWRGRRLPEFIIRQLMGLDKKINYKHTDVYKA
ncbi:hypothetical protein EVAR_8572_1 [Eumeta japonica]|uniref:Ribosomal protein mS38 C-terminal domain-containing protein n=1 Tax=Eumeta variegata TaxID=151549 RepID=A0A4C1TXI1_EUMVA|nr:hypothetical protein EVAR_8572_1 [Eumeta japonica]